MIVESFGFIVTVAVFGVIIVFGLLIAMLGFMAGLLGADRGLSAGGKRGAPGPLHVLPVGPGAKPDTADWVIGAAIAYLVHEEEDTRPEAASWTTGRAYREDPWVVQQIGDQR